VEYIVTVAVVVEVSGLGMGVLPGVSSGLRLGPHPEEAVR
jgi:hypothetical protein